jgi:hypothetical protein
MTPHIEALAYRIWAYANPREWDCSHAEIADGTGISIDMVAQVISAKGWKGRVPRGGPMEAANGALHRRGYAIDHNIIGVDQLMR